MGLAHSIPRLFSSVASLIPWRCRGMLALLVAGFLCAMLACGGASSTPAQRADSGATIVRADFPVTGRAPTVEADPRSAARTPAQPGRAQIGFRSREQLDEHYAKHGSEFGQVTEQEYLRLAQLLRDAPVAGNVEEIARRDGTISRYDRASGAFIAFDTDGTIRTFFKPNDGEAYFRRQALRSH